MKRYGQVPDSDDDGPAVSRATRHTCTDIPCCILFLVAVGWLIYVFIWGHVNGDIRRLYHGINGEGQVCGVDDAVSDKGLLYWCPVWNSTTLASVDLVNPVCVSSCPSDGVEVPECASTPISFASQELMARYCIPDTSVYTDVSNSISDIYFNDYNVAAWEKLSSIPSAWPVFLVTFFVALIIGYCYMFLLKCFAEPLIWASILLSIIGLISFGVFLWITSSSLGAQNTLDVASDAEITKGLAVVMWILAGAMMLLTCCFCNSIRLAAAVIEVAVDVMWEMPTLLVLPGCKSVVKAFSYLLLMYGFLVVWTVADITTFGDGLYRHFTHDALQWCYIVSYCFCMFWILAFLTALYQFTVAFAVQEYYFDEDVNCCGVSSILKGALYGCTLHVGSIAFGSAIVAIIETLDKILQFIENENKHSANNPCVSMLVCCCMCWLDCVKSCVEFINKNAYIDIAVTSNSFCWAARNALATIASFGGAMLILNGATWIFSLIATTVIVVSCGLISDMILQLDSFTNNESDYFVDDPTLATVIACGLAFLISLTFMSIFDMTSDTLLYCFGHDVRTGKNTGHAPAALRDLIRTYKSH